MDIMEDRVAGIALKARRRISPRPQIERIRLLFLIARAVGFPHQRKAARFVEAARGPVALEGQS
jgi:hypothetical protein